MACHLSSSVVTGQLLSFVSLLILAILTNHYASLFHHWCAIMSLLILTSSLCLLVPPSGVIMHIMLLQVADEHQLTLNLELPQASRAKAQAAPEQKAGQSEQQDDLTARLAELRGR